MSAHFHIKWFCWTKVHNREKKMADPSLAKTTIHHAYLLPPLLSMVSHCSSMQGRGTWWHDEGHDHWGNRKLIILMMIFPIYYESSYIWWIFLYMMNLPCGKKIYIFRICYSPQTQFYIGSYTFYYQVENKTEQNWFVFNVLNPHPVGIIFLTIFVI